MRGIGAGMRVFEVLDRSPAIPHAQGDEVKKDHLGVVKFERVFFEYPSRKGVPILKDFELELVPGQSVAIVCVSSCIAPYQLFITPILVVRAGEESLLYILFSCDTMILFKARLRVMGKVRLEIYCVCILPSHAVQIFASSPQLRGARQSVLYPRTPCCSRERSLPILHSETRQLRGRRSRM